MRVFNRFLGGHRASIYHKGQERRGESLYEVYVSKSRREALEFLHEQEVKEPFYYVIVETPEGNIGKDVISIFDEESGKTLELGKRKPLPKLRKSRTHCTQCGHFVFPVKPLLKEVHYFLSLEELAEKGNGLYCPSCQTVWCALCVSLRETKAICKLCEGTMIPYQTTQMP